MIVLGPIVALAALWLLGALSLSLAGARRGTSRGVEVVVLDFVAGVVVLAALGMTTLAAGGRLALAPCYLLLLLLATATAWRRRTRPLPGPLPRRELPQAPGARTLIAMTAAVLLLLALSASQDRLVWDGWAFWTLKARILFLEGTFPATVLDPAGPYRYAHPDYPLAVPLLDWWLYRHAGMASPALASLAGTFWFATLPALVWAALRDPLGETRAALATLGIAAFWPLAFYAAGGYADIVIALALLGTVLELERSRRCPAPGAPLRVAIYLGLAALAKNEGLALALIGAMVALACWLQRDRRRHLARIPQDYAPLALPILALAPWFLWTRRLGLAPEHLAGATPSFGDALSRIPVIGLTAGELLLSRAWVPLPLLVLLGVYAALRRGRLVAPAGWAVVAGYGVAIGGVYLTTSVDLEWLLHTTLDRLLGDLVPAVVVLALWEAWGSAGVELGQGEPARMDQDSIARRMTSASSVGLE